MALTLIQLPAFTWGANGERLTPDQIAKRRQVAEAMMERGMDTSPVQHWTQGLARVAQAGVGAFNEYRADQDEAAARKAWTDEYGADVDAIFEAQRTAGLDDGSAFIPGPENASFYVDTAAPPQGQPATGGPAVTPFNAIPEHRKALLDAIAGPESAGRYDILYGGGSFGDYSAHPGQNIPITSGPNAGKTSSAAGRYQFLAPTWNEYRDKLGLQDFSPASQDQAAWALASDRYRAATGQDLDNALQSGDPAAIAQVGEALAGTWTSLPGGIEQQLDGGAWTGAFNDARSGAQNRNQALRSVSQALMRGQPGQPAVAPHGEAGIVAALTAGAGGSAAVGQPQSDPRYAGIIEALASPEATPPVSAYASPSQADAGIVGALNAGGGRGAPSMPPQGPRAGAPAPANAGLPNLRGAPTPDFGRLVAAYSDPWAPPEQKQVLGMLIEQRLGQMDPNAGLDRQLRELQVRQAQLDYDQDRGGVGGSDADMPAAVQTYQFYADQERQADREPVSFADWAGAGQGARDWTPGERSELFGLEDTIQAGDYALNALDEAMALNDTAADGPYAAERATASSFIPDLAAPGTPIIGGTQDTDTATLRLNNLTTELALTQLKAVFGSMPTEGERKILLEMQGAVSQPRAVRAEIYRRAKQMAERRIADNRARAEALRTGAIYQPGFSLNAPTAAPPKAGMPQASPPGGITPDPLGMR